MFHTQKSSVTVCIFETIKSWAVAYNKAPFFGWRTTFFLPLWRRGSSEKSVIQVCSVFKATICQFFTILTLKGLPHNYTSWSEKIALIYRNSVELIFFPGLIINTYTNFQKTPAPNVPIATSGCLLQWKLVHVLMTRPGKKISSTEFLYMRAIF